MGDYMERLKGLRQRTVQERVPKNQVSEILKEMRKMQRDVLLLKEAVKEIKDECIYPPEEKLNKEFIKEAEEADKRIKAGVGKVYTPEEFKAKFS